MSVTAYALCGFIMMLLLTLIIFSGKVHPIVVFALLPVLIAMICGFSIDEIGEWVTNGVKSQVATATMFVFAIIFFSCMMDSGVFDKIIGKLLGGAKNVTSVCILTVICTMIGHMDGSGATTFLLVIPPFLLIYQRMKMRPIVLVSLVTCTAGVMNELPWAGNCGRVAAGLQIGTSDVFMTALPGFIIGLCCCFALAVFFSRREIKRGAGLPEGMNLKQFIAQANDDNTKKNELVRPKLFVFNLVLIVITIVIIFLIDKIPTFLVFAVAAGIALTVNYPGSKTQTERLKEYAPSCMTMAAVVLGTGIYTGILNNSPMMSSMTKLIGQLVNDSVSAHLNTVLGFLWAPLSTLGLGHTSTCNGILPMVHSICASHLTKAQVGASYLMVFSPRVFVSPTTAAMYVGLGLAGIDLKEHLRFSLFWSHAVSTIAFAGCLLLGVIPF